MSPRLELVKSKTILIRESLVEYNQVLSPKFTKLAEASTTKHKSNAFMFQEPRISIKLNNEDDKIVSPSGIINDKTPKDPSTCELHLHHLKPYLNDIKNKKSQ